MSDDLTDLQEMKKEANSHHDVHQNDHLSGTNSTHHGHHKEGEGNYTHYHGHASEAHSMNHHKDANSTDSMHGIFTIPEVDCKDVVQPLCGSVSE